MGGLFKIDHSLNVFYFIFAQLGDSVKADHSPSLQFCTSMIYVSNTI